MDDAHNTAKGDTMMRYPNWLLETVLTVLEFVRFYTSRLRCYSI